MRIFFQSPACSGHENYDRLVLVDTISVEWKPRSIGVLTNRVIVSRYGSSNGKHNTDTNPDFQHEEEECFIPEHSFPSLSDNLNPASRTIHREGH